MNRNEIKTNTDNKPKISFGIIVLNGEPFTKYCLRSLYNFAYEIIIVEGATKNAKTISSPSGHSRDSTLQSISEFIQNEDAEKKVKLITKDGYWEEKNEMSQAYTKEATGNYLWQIDIDEFYMENDMEKIISLLSEDSSITAISFKMKSFWGGINYVEEGPVFGDINRLFKFGPNYKYINHRPPTVIDNQGRNLKDMKWIDGTKMEKLNIYMYHYGLIFPLEVSTKSEYYVNTFNKDFQKWAENNYSKLGDPYHVNDNFWSISWLRRYDGQHPQQIRRMFEDINTKKIIVEERNNIDIEKLLKSPIYLTTTFVLRLYFKFTFKCKRFIKKLLKNVPVLIKFVNK